MAIPSRPIGQGPQAELLWNISKQMDELICTTCGISGTSGTSGTSGSSGSSGATPILPISLNYGLFSQTGASADVTGTTVETTLIDGGVGTLTVPANGFSVGDSFRAVMNGQMNVANNQTIRIRVKAGSIILADSGVQNITNLTGNVWFLNIDFTVRQIGAAGIASLASVGSFHYTKTVNGTVEGFSFNTTNSTTFDTTTSNTLNITVQWGSNNAGNTIHSDVFVLNKTY